MTVTLDDFLSAHDAAHDLSYVARLLGVDRRTVAAACADGSLPSVRVGRRILIPHAPLAELLTKGAA